MKLASEARKSADCIPLSKKAARAVRIFSTFLLCSCAAGPASQPLRRPESPAAPVGVSQGAPAPLQGTLVSSWERGRCTFERNLLSYYDAMSGETGSLRLDVKMGEGRVLLCSEGFTVVVGYDKAAVAIGAEGVLDGREMLGMISGRFVAANSYEVEVAPALLSRGGIAASRLAGETLQLSSPQGMRWTIRLTDPFAGWSVRPAKAEIY